MARLRTLLVLAVAAALIALPVSVAEATHQTGCGFLGLEPCPHPDPDVNPDGSLIILPGENPYGLASLPAPVRGQEVFPLVNGKLPWGLNTNYIEELPVDYDVKAEEVASMLEAMGASLARVTLYWPTLEYNNNEYRWAAYDKVYRALVKHGVRPVWTIMYTPRWAVAVHERTSCFENGNYCAAEPDPLKLAELRSFTGAIARRYSLSAGIEYRNEPDLPQNELGVRKIEVGRYTTNLKAAHEGVKAARPAMRVFGGALSAEGDVEGYLRGMLERGAGDAMDALTFHPYAANTDPDQFIARFVPIRNALEAHGRQDMRLFPDEIGAATTETQASQTGGAIVFDEPGQSARLMGQYNDLNGRRQAIPLVDNVDGVAYYSMVDLLPPPDSDGVGYGWVRRKGSDGKFTPKAVFCDFRRDVGGHLDVFAGNAFMHPCPS